MKEWLTPQEAASWKRRHLNDSLEEREDSATFSAGGGAMQNDTIACSVKGKDNGSVNTEDSKLA